jgi:hypothetical protein
VTERVWLRVLVLLVIGALASRPAEACDCASPKTTCEGIARTDAVFVGTVTDVVRSGRFDLETTVAVGETFRGRLQKTVLIKTAPNGGNCDYRPFVKGERMLFYARKRSDGAFHVFGCSRTALVKDAAADLKYLRDAVKHDVGHVGGKVMFEDGSPRANVEVRAIGANATRSIRTSADGRYDLDLPPDTYRLEPSAEPGLAPRKLEPLVIDSPGVCVSRDFVDQWNGRVRGVLRGADGKPAANVLVRAFPTNVSVPAMLEPGDRWLVGREARSDAKGAFEIGPLAPGAYRVAVGMPFLASEAMPPVSYPRDVTVTQGNVVTGIDLIVPKPYVMHRITGTVKLAGKVAQQHVNLEITMTELSTKRGGTRFRSIDPWDFEFVEVAGSTVEIRACANELDCTSARVRLDRDQHVDLTLQLR